MNKSIKWMGAALLTLSLILLASPAYAQGTTPSQTQNIDPIILLLLGLGFAAVLMIFGAYGLHSRAGSGNHDEDDE